MQEVNVRILEVGVLGRENDRTLKTSLQETSLAYHHGISRLQLGDSPVLLLLLPTATRPSTNSTGQSL